MYLKLLELGIAKGERVYHGVPEFKMYGHPWESSGKRHHCHKDVCHAAVWIYCMEMDNRIEMVESPFGAQTVGCWEPNPKFLLRSWEFNLISSSLLAQIRHLFQKIPVKKLWISRSSNFSIVIYSLLPTSVMWVITILTFEVHPRNSTKSRNARGSGLRGWHVSTFIAQVRQTDRRESAMWTSFVFMG